MIFSAVHRSLLRWHSLVGLILAVVLFVPITKYRLPANLPFNLELYRLVVALVVVLWLSSLLIDPRVRLRRTYFDPPLLLIVFWALASEVANPGRVDSLSSYVAKSLTFFLSFVFVYYVTASVIRTQRGAVPAQVSRPRLRRSGRRGALRATQRAQRLLPPPFHRPVSPVPGRRRDLALRPVAGPGLRAAPDRARRDARRPVPLAVYFARTAGRRWWAAVAILLLGALATGSRTAIVMLIAMTDRVPAAQASRDPADLAAAPPGDRGRPSGRPRGDRDDSRCVLSAGRDHRRAVEARAGRGSQPGGRPDPAARSDAQGGGRAPALRRGLGTRITGFGRNIFRNAPILDNQWLNTMLEFGYVGVAFWLWLFVRSVRRLFRASREPEDGDDWLFAGLAAAITGFGVGMFTFDAFGFTQITFVFWILLGLSAAMLRINEEMRAEVRELAPRMRPAQESS